MYQKFGWDVPLSGATPPSFHCFASSVRYKSSTFEWKWNSCLFPFCLGFLPRKDVQKALERRSFIPSAFRTLNSWLLARLHRRLYMRLLPKQVSTASKYIDQRHPRMNGFFTYCHGILYSFVNTTRLGLNYKCSRLQCEGNHSLKPSRLCSTFGIRGQPRVSWWHASPHAGHPRSERRTTFYPHLKRRDG